MAEIQETMMSFHLSDTERQRFARDGFIGPFSLFEPEQMPTLWRRVQRGLMDSTHAAYPQSRLNFDRHLDLPDLWDLVRRLEVAHRVQSLFDNAALCWRSSWFPKKPGAEGTNWHQTEAFVEFEGSAKLIPTHRPEQALANELTAWVAFTDSTVDNGCLQFIPGSQVRLNYDEVKNVQFRPEQVGARSEGGVKRGFYGYDYSELKLDSSWSPDESKAVNMTMRAGQFVIFTSRCLHASLPNTTTDQTRMGYAMRYCASHVQVYPDRHEFNFFGERFGLDRYGCVLVAGDDEHGHNRMRTTRLTGP